MPISNGSLNKILAPESVRQSFWLGTLSGDP